MSGFVQRQRTGPPVDQQALQHSAAMHGQVVDLFPGGALGPVRSTWRPAASPRSIPMTRHHNAQSRLYRCS